MKTAVKFLIALVLSLLLAWAVRTYVFTIFSVPQGGLPPQLKAGNRVIVNRIDYENFGRGDVVVFTDTVVYQPKNQRRKCVFESHFIGRIEKLPGDTLRIDTMQFVIPTICCKRCGCKDCRFYLLKTPTGQQLVHKHQMIGKAHKLF